MKIVPVIDVRHGIVVRGVGGRRHEYRPIQSRLTPSTEPCAVAVEFREQFGLTTLYVADLDAILDCQPHCSLYADLTQSGFQIWVDAGVRSAESAAAVSATGVDTVIVGLESWTSPAMLPEFVQRFGSEGLMFSLDLRNGEPMLAPEWADMSPREIAELSLEAGFRRLLVLDLSDVGTSTGGRTDDLLRDIRGMASDIALVAGGGVRHVADLERLSDLGVDAVLVASALHDGRLMPADLQPYL